MIKNNYYQKSIETIEEKKLRKLQNDRLINQIKYVWNNVQWYRNKMIQQGITIENIKNIDDLSKLPFVTKKDLIENYPYGFLATPLENCVRVHSTSGTTGKRVNAFYTKKDLEISAECCARNLVSAGVKKSDIVQISFGYGLFTGGLGFHDSCNKLECLTIPISTGNTERQIQYLNDLKPTVLCTTPSYAMYLADVLMEKDLNYKTNLRIGIFGAEAWTEEMRKAIEKKLNIKAYDTYGLTELNGPGVAFECVMQNGMHINEDHFIAEIIDPESGEILKDGEVGELVLTSITKEAFPLIRYRTKDLCFLKRETCSCGRTFVRMSKPLGRSDDMLIIKGINVFPSQIESVLIEYFMPLYYQIVINRIKNTDVFEINVEITNDMANDNNFNSEILINKIKKSLKSVLGISVNINLLQSGTLDRYEGKSIKVIDNRNLFKNEEVSCVKK